jgi:hypothetical protein
MQDHETVELGIVLDDRSGNPHPVLRRHVSAVEQRIQPLDMMRRHILSPQLGHRGQVAPQHRGVWLQPRGSGRHSNRASDVEDANARLGHRAD